MSASMYIILTSTDIINTYISVQLLIHGVIEAYISSPGWLYQHLLHFGEDIITPQADAQREIIRDCREISQDCKDVGTQDTCARRDVFTSL